MDGLTPNAVIAWNMRRLRRERGWTQAELAERMSERDDKLWTFSMVSDAETAGRAGRDRQFTVNEVSLLA
ncbi:MAG: helix-turn-helix transcriptional regulator, partial [Actinobacteria bacterium]|nr:helix-turn-helix transcriptional regulator [Actinomycetota bacterium]